MGNVLHRSKYQMFYSYKLCLIVPPKVKYIVSAISFIGIQSRELKTYVHAKSCTNYFLAALFLVAER